MKIGAEIEKGRKVALGVRFLVVPISQKVYRQIINERLVDIFLDASAFISVHLRHVSRRLHRHPHRGQEGRDIH